MSSPIVTVVGNPRRDSRTHGLARTLAGALARELDSDAPVEVDLATLGPAVLDPDDERANAAIDDVLAGEVLVIASPTYKATYSGLLKAFLDRLGTGALAGAAAVPVLLGGASNHQLAIDVHFVPLLFELGAQVPGRGLFVLEADVPQFGHIAERWARAHAPLILAPGARCSIDAGAASPTS
ncbi:MAG: NAD(P)H-dependent oxidoreductase [Solirubrobacterales bacterium]|nr:NAD(P)H-dependent oxidoreductase [Solirubrobacterales bacterium]